MSDSNNKINVPVAGTSQSSRSRMVAAQQRPSGSNLKPASGTHPAATRPSARQAPIQRAPSSGERLAVPKKRAASGGKELMIAGAVIALLGLAAMGLWMKRK